MAHKKGVGSSKNGRESESKRLGESLIIRLVVLEIRQSGRLYRRLPIMASAFGRQSANH
jgi:hypothetical protein